MKKLMFVVAAMIFVSTVFGQTFVQSENDVTLSKAGTSITGTLFVQKNFNTKSKFGFSNFVLVTKNWAEITPSITYTPGKFSFNVGFGLETAKPYWRFTSGMVFVDSLNLAKLFFERGGGKENYWWHASYERNVGKFTAGVMSRRFYGSGLRVGYKMSKNILLQVAPLYDHEAKIFRTSTFLTYTL